MARVSHSVSFADYRAALTAPGARSPVLASVLGRLPIAMIGLALLLYVQRETGSFAAAGIVSAGALVGVAIGSVIQGRIMDRLGPSRPLLVVTAAFGVLVAGEVLAIESHAPLGVLLPLAVLVGATEPMVGPASRSLWSELVPAGPVRNAAYSYEAISMESFFLLGPGLAGVLVAMPWAGAGTVIGSASMILGSVWFALTPAVRAQRPQSADRAPGSLLGPLTSPGMRTVALAALGFGALLGSIEVAVPAAAERAGNPIMGGVLISVLSVSSVIVGVLYGLNPWPKPMHLRLPALLLGFALLIAVLAVPSTLWGLCLALLLAGSLITPQATAHSVALEIAAPAGTATEAFGWVITSVTLGAAFGQSIAGQVVEMTDPPTAFLVAAIEGVVLTGWLWLRRGTLVPSRSEVTLAGV